MTKLKPLHNVVTKIINCCQTTMALNQDLMGFLCCSVLLIIIYMYLVFME